MSLRPFDVIEVHEQHSSGWWEGRRLLEVAGEHKRVLARSAARTAKT
jgi:hypothetical protein